MLLFGILARKLLERNFAQLWPFGAAAVGEVQGSRERENAQPLSAMHCIEVMLDRGATTRRALSAIRQNALRRTL
jgi:hypothetical protein